MKPTTSIERRLLVRIDRQLEYVRKEISDCRGKLARLKQKEKQLEITRQRHECTLVRNRLGLTADAHPEEFDVSILDLSPKTQEALAAQGIKKLGDLTSLTTSDFRFKVIAAPSWRQAERTRIEVQKQLSRFGLSFLPNVAAKHLFK